jgi:two-component system, OmpR family, sensor histidine kinase KdpD
MPARTTLTEKFSPRQRIALSVLACAVTTGISVPLSLFLDLANMVMLFLLTVLLVAVKLGRNAAVVAAVLSVLLFDIFFVPPRFSLAVHNVQYLVTFAVMLATALITGHLTATLKQQADEAQIREQRTRALYEVARKLAGALSHEQVTQIIADFVATEFKGDPQAAQQPDNKALFDALSSLADIAAERLRYVEIAQGAELAMTTERLRSSILSALSHDLRTPLTVLVGLADSLSLIKPPLPAQASDTAEALRAQAGRLATLVTNLLEMARLNAGGVSLRLEWQPLEEVIGSSLKLLGSALSQHHIEVRLPADLPLLRFDAVMIERVLCNLLENAAKYAPPGSIIEITARHAGETAEITVRDHGPGLPAADRQALFEMFVRGQRESDIPGTGLGLAICRAIVEAHGGRIWVDMPADGGGCIRFSLPSGEPPVVEAETA